MSQSKKNIPRNIEKISVNTQHLAWMDNVKREKNINKRRNLI